jgi:malonyl CoA-acyl carrier protein transacylase
MSQTLLVILPAGSSGLASAVSAAGGTPVVDLTCGLDEVPQGAWVRVLAGQDAPGDGPALLATPGEPLSGRETWLEVTEPGPVPEGFAGLLLRGREAAGRCGTEDGLLLLQDCPEPQRVLLDAGLGPDTAAAAAALGAGGVVLSEQLWALPELGLGPHVRRKARRCLDTGTRVVGGHRVAGSPMSPVVRMLAGGADFWELAQDWARSDDPVTRALPAGQGLALAGTLARRHADIAGVLGAYRTAIEAAPSRMAAVQSWADAGSPRGRSGLALSASNGRSYIAEASGAVGSGVLWQLAAWEGLPVTGAPTLAAAALGVPVLAEPAALEEIRQAHASARPSAPTPEPDPAPTVAPMARHELVAIVGLGCVLPDAPDIQQFWSNIVSGRDSVTNVPDDRWDAGLFFDEDKKTPDKTYSKIGAFVRDFEFDSKGFRIPPSVARSIDLVQKMALTAVGEALEDAGVRKGSGHDRSRIAVILGNSMGGGETRDNTNLRVYTPQMRQALEQVPEFQGLPQAVQDQIAAGWELAFKKDLPDINEDSMPGELSNVIAGRVANAFDLGGPNFTVDAACASSMAAVQAAVKGLQDGDFDMAVTGGSDRTMDVPTYTKFCKIGALSPDHSSPFDVSANGFVMGEGAGVMVLKRLSDAERDGDRIYAVIRGFGASSDGKGKGITAPNILGQKRALRRAYADAGMDPVEVDLVECHGTSTVVGDKIEVEALSEVIGTNRRGARGPIRIGSVKSQIGHLKSAAGAAAMIKTALALHHRTLPPSINFQSPRTDVPFDAVPLKVQTRAEPWRAEGWTRAAGVSAFGFGGTNFHAVLVEHTPPAHTLAVDKPAPTSQIEVLERPLPQGIWATSGRDLAALGRNLDRLARGESAPWNPSMPLRVAAAADSVEERASQIDKAHKAIAKGKGFDLLRMRQIHLEDTPCDGKLAFLFTGQGSQYLNMGLDLAERYPVVKATFDEADEICIPELGRPIRDYIIGVGADEAESFERLRATEISQPATLTVDTAILRLLASWGILPDVVAGHSLGEYGALIAAGVMTFKDSLVAVTARGREMAHIQLEDPGAMAGIAAGPNVVAEVLAEIGGYVIAANKNSPKQTVIAGASDAVEAACEIFRSREITVYPLPVSHAFHSAIVAPASEPLGKVLAKLDIQPPRRPVTTNVTSNWYPETKEAIVDLLAKQVAAPVEWVDQVERLYADGSRVFVEVGPKRALTGMVAAILKGRPHRALSTNHPKQGGERSFRDSLAALVSMGMPVTETAGAEIPDILAAPGERFATSDKIAAARGAEDKGELQATPYVIDTVMSAVASRAGIDAEELDVDLEFEADLGIDTVRQAETVAELRTRFKLDREAGFLLSDHRSIRSLVDYFAGRLGQLEPQWDRSAPAVATQPRRPLSPAQPQLPATTSSAPAAAIGTDAVAAFLATVARTGLAGIDAESFASALLPAVKHLIQASYQAFEDNRVEVESRGIATQPQGGIAPVRIVCTGASVGLPGGAEVFDPDNFQSILRGDNRISVIGEDYRKRFLDKDLVRLVKDEAGQGSFLPVDDDEQVIHLAGRAAEFDLARDYGVSASWIQALDRTTELAFAAGLEALRDAGIPLVRTYHTTKGGKQVATGWALPEALRDGTGIVFASAFPGHEQLISKILSNGADEAGHYDRRFLFQVLSMGHSQFAQFIGARGPNTQVNSACSSTTMACAIAEDWIRLGRCERVIVLGADDVTTDTMLEWFGSAFMAAGAATTAHRVEDGALPFDRRRHGMILGMGAVALVLERAEDAEARGITPVAELMGTRIANSAFHGSRLDSEHICGEMKKLVDAVSAAEGIRPAELARKLMFMSHETYTPARGGSASAEIAALRASFGAAANQVVVSNTKGFTGHPMGASIEDAIAIKALQYRTVPPIPNLREPDPELGDLRLSQGGSYPIDYALRMSAGFGSQLALAVWKRVAVGDARQANAQAAEAWLSEVCGLPAVRLVVQERTLRALPGRLAAAPKPTPAAQAAPSPEPVPVPAGVSRELILDHLLGVIAEKTGYEREDLEVDYELEADLGIDTVKQAEIFSEVRDHYGVERDEDFNLADYATIASLAGWLSSKVGNGAAAPQEAPVPSDPSPVEPAPARANTGILEHLLAVISEKTGYEREDLDLDYELEADLGIDTVKQAEIFSEVRDHFGVEREDDFNLADYPTIGKLADWLSAKVGGTSTPASSSPEMSEDYSEHPDDPPSELPPSFWIRRPVRVRRPSTLSGNLTGRKVQIMGDGPVVEALVEELGRRGAGQPQAGEVPDTVIDVASDVLEVFRAAKVLVDKGVRDWICLTMLGEHEGMTPDQAWFDGSRCGFTKALNREWKDCYARVIDVAPEVDPDSIASLLCDELSGPDGSVEIFHDNEGHREVIELAVEGHPEAGRPPADNQVVIATGGGRGITAQVAMEFCRRSPTTMVLVGRSPAAEQAVDLKAEKDRIKAELKAAGERGTPAQIERQLGKLRKAEEIRANVEYMRALGSTVEYRTCEMADPAAVRNLVAEVRSRYGRVDGVIHGAGVEESRLIQDKDEDAFHRVFDGKALGGLALAEAIDESAWLLSMGSVAGRFGNEGQVDYAAANEALAQVCTIRPHSLHVDWTAWGDVGMAVRGGMQTLLEARGVELMPALAGAALAVDLIAARAEGEVVVAGRLGDFVPSPNHPKLDSMELDGEVVVARYKLDAERDPWILDHSIDGKPVLPGVMGVELMAAAAHLARPGRLWSGLREVAFKRPVKLYRGEPTHLEMRAVPQLDGTVRCTLFSERPSKTGKLIRNEHFSGTVLLDTRPELAPIPPAFWAEDAVSRGDIYRRFFHGPAFQVLRGAEAVARDGLLCSARVDHAYIADALITSPLALEAAFQAAGLHTMVSEGVMALPESVEASWVARRVRDGEDLQITVLRRADGAYDLDVDGEDGRVMSVRGFRMVETGPLPEAHRFQPPEEGWVETAFGTAVVVAGGGENLRALLTEAIAGSASVGEDSAPWMTEAELDDLRKRGTPKRQADRLAGRIAAKRALAALTGARAEQIRIENLASGQPIAMIDGQPGPAISISHSGGVAVALASRVGRIGVDIEQIEPRSESFAEDWFAATEREFLAGDEDLTLAWAVKEAVLKALGQGMALHPTEVQVRAVDGEDVIVELVGEAAEAHAAMGAGEVVVRAVVKEGRVQAEARIAGD